MRDSSSRSSIVRGTRCASSTILLGEAVDDLEVVLVDERLGEHGQRPDGVFSSWLMLATKSVRTASSAARSLMSSIVATAPPAVERSGRARRRTRRGGPYSSTVCCDSLTADAPCASVAVDRLVDEQRRCASPPIASAAWLRKRTRPDAPRDDDAEGQPVERRRSTAAP